MTRPTDDPGSETRRQILRRATVYTVSFLGAAIVIALLGAAFVAWLLTWRGQPFLRTWLIAAAIIMLPGFVAAVWKLIRGR
jgi:ABC-type sugar transport system permease subunit